MILLLYAVGIDILSSSLKLEKDKVLLSLTKKLDKINKKLQPLLEDRDKIKARLGPEIWDDNPKRKEDYALKRRRLEETKAMIESSIIVIQPLEVIPFN